MTDIFLSYSTQNAFIAGQILDDLTASGVSVWIDQHKIRAGDQLSERIQNGISSAAKFVLLWSRSAAESNYVRREFGFAVQSKKPLVPCRLDDTELPALLEEIRYCDFRQYYTQAIDELIEVLGGDVAAPKSRRQVTLAAVQKMILSLHQSQQKVIIALVREGSGSAARIQGELEKKMNEALATARDDAMVLNLAGYHKKNSYMLKYWPEIQQHQSPPDPLLAESERFFHESLATDPEDQSALNGLGSVLMLRRDLDGAEFFIRRALARSEQLGQRYPEAEHDLQTVLGLKAGP